jgi:hypothetical protein
MLHVHLLALAIAAAAPSMKAKAPPVPDPSLDVVFGFTQPLTVPGKPPKVWVKIVNMSDRPVPFIRFQSDKCFVQFYLHLTLHTPTGHEHTAASCAIRSWPGVKSTLAAQAVERRTMPLHELFPGVPWDEGEYSLEAVWGGGELAKLVGDEYLIPPRVVASGPPAKTHGLGLRLRLVLKKPIQERFLVKAGEEVVLPDGARYKLKGHTHKMTMNDPPVSPLITYGTFAAPGEKQAQDFLRHHLPDSPLFKIGQGYLFELADSDYGKSATLIYFGQVEGI